MLLRSGGVLRAIFFLHLLRLCVGVGLVLLYVRWFATACAVPIEGSCRAPCEGAGVLAALCTYVRKGFSLPARLGFVFLRDGVLSCLCFAPDARGENRFAGAEEAKSRPCPMTVAIISHFAV
jgi:hypothetical protein